MVYRDGFVSGINEHKCDFELIACSSGCGQDVFRCHLETHLKDCPQRDSICPLCNATGAFCLISSKEHHQECPGVIITCSNDGCGESFPRKDQTSHSEACPKKLVACSYSSVGCEEICKRENLEEHCKTCVNEHLSLSYGKVMKFEEDKRLLNSNTNAVVAMKGYKDRLLSSKWYSPYFYSSPGGYKMCLLLTFCENKDLVCRVLVTAGEHDKNLDWPLKKFVSVTLLNQVEDKCHYYRPALNLFYPPFHPSLAKFQRTLESCKAIASSAPYFIKHSVLTSPVPVCHRCYVMNDTLYFRISVTSEIIKKWLITTD